MNVMIINAHSASHCGRLLDKQINLMKERGEWGKLHFTKPINDPVLCDQENFRFKNNKSIESLWEKNALVVSGTTLKFIFDQDTLSTTSNQVNNMNKLNSTLPKVDEDGNIIENGKTVKNLIPGLDMISFIRWIKKMRQNRKRSRTVYPASDPGNEYYRNDGNKSIFSMISSTFSQGDKKSKKESMSILQKKFVELGIRCHVVICCRATPSQKAKVVNIIKTNLNKMTLAIGDGANDVAMIQKAHIGIGIIGREGAQAMRASDYAILEFKFLKTLLCIHGRYSLLRVSKMIYHSFYKNFVFTLIQFFYITVSYWSGTVSIFKNNTINF